MDEPQELNARIPPSNLEAERCVLGAVMQDREALSVAMEMLHADDFYSPANREIFDAMHALHTRGMPVDLVTVDEELSRRGTLAGVGGSEYLIEISQYVPTTANVKAYIQIVDEKATLRRLIKASAEISQECYHQAAQLLKECTSVIDAGTPVGRLNEKNGNLLSLAHRLGKPVTTMKESYQ